MSEVHGAQLALCKACGVTHRIQSQDFVESSTGTVFLAKLRLAIAELQHAVGHFIGIRKLRKQAFEALHRDFVILGDVIAFTQPIPGIRRQLRVRIIVDESLEQTRGLDIVFLFQCLESDAVGSFFSGRVGRIA